MASRKAESINISFEKLGVLLIKRGKRWQYLRDCGISPGIVAKIKDGTGHIDTRTIQRICEVLHCQPGQIMEYKPSSRTVAADSESKEPLNEFEGVPFM